VPGGKGEPHEANIETPEHCANDNGTHGGDRLVEGAGANAATDAAQTLPRTTSAKRDLVTATGVFAGAWLAIC